MVSGLREGNPLLHPAAGVDLRKAEVEAPVLEQVVEFRGSQQEPVRHVRVEGFRIAHTASTFFKQYEAPSRGDWTIHRGGAVFAEGAEHCSVENCFLMRWAATGCS